MTLEEMIKLRNMEMDLFCKEKYIEASERLKARRKFEDRIPWETEEEKEERKINEIMQSMHKHKRKEKQEPMGLRKDPFNVLFDEELMLRYIYKEYDEDRR